MPQEPKKKKKQLLKRAVASDPKNAATVSRGSSAHAESALADSVREPLDTQEIYKCIFKQAPVSILVMDGAGRIVDVNPYHVAHVGKGKTSEDDYLGKNVITHPTIVKAGLSEAYTNLLEGNPFDLKEVYFPVTTGGKSTYFNVKGVPLVKKGQVIGAISIIEDITEQKGIQKALESSVQLYRMLAENVRDVIWTTDLNLHFTYVSPSVTHLLGYSVEETMNKPLRKILTPPSSRLAVEIFAKELSIEESEHRDLQRSRRLEVEYRCKDGSPIWTEVNVTFLRHENGQAFGILGVTRDISARKQFEDALIESEQKYKSVIDNIGIGVALISPNMKILTLNSQMKKWFAHIDVSNSPLCYASFNNPPGETPCSYCPTIRTLKDGKVHEAVTDTPAGQKVIHYRIISSPIKDKKGKVVAAIEMVEDITGRKHAEEALQEAHDELELRVQERTCALADAVRQLERQIQERKQVEDELRRNEERFRTVADFTYDWEYWIGNDGKYLYNSPSCERVTGYGRSEFFRDPGFLVRIVHPDDREMVVKHTRQSLKSKETQRLDFRIITRTGEERWISHACVPVYNASGEMNGRRASNRDITERKRAQEALEESLAKFKVFAYSVLHDLKSPAVGLSGIAKLLRKQYGNVLDDKGKLYCDQILNACEQISTLVDQINVYISTKEAPISIEGVKLEEPLQMVREEFRAQLTKRQIKWAEPDSLPEVRVDKVSILRVFRNLVDNALKYGGEGLSEIKIGYDESADFHILSVEDDGVGIKREASKKIFGLFNRYETARGIEGTGLGLAIVKEIAEQHRGQVWAEPGPKRGITFYFSVPKHL